MYLFFVSKKFATAPYLWYTTANNIGRVRVMAEEKEIDLVETEGIEAETVVEIENEKIREL